jgi:hypothetical protein
MDHQKHGHVLLYLHSYGETKLDEEVRSQNEVMHQRWGLIGKKERSLRRI